LVEIVGEDVAELAADGGIVIGRAMGSLGPFALRDRRVQLLDECESRRYDIEGETARRLEAVDKDQSAHRSNL
jgi:hypothetical protein